MSEDIGDFIKKTIRESYMAGQVAGVLLSKDTLGAIRQALIENGLAGPQLDAVNGMVDGFGAVADEFISRPSVGQVLTKPQEGEQR